MTEAILLAAGEGRRLLPITKFIPKSLLPIVNTPLLEGIITFLKHQGITKIIVNVYHLKEKLIDFIKQNDFGVDIKISVEEQILGTGGGIGRMKNFITSDDFIVYNSDIVTDIVLREVWKFHKRNKAIATLILVKRENSKDVLLSGDGKVIDIAGRLKKQGQNFFQFTGIAILNREIFNYLPDNEFYNIIEAYEWLIKDGKNIYGFVSHGSYWRDIGTKKNYLQVHRDVLIKGKNIFDRQDKIKRPFFIGKNSIVNKDIKLSGFVSIGENCTLGTNSKLENCIVFDDTQIKKDSIYKNCIISNKFQVCLPDFV